MDAIKKFINNHVVFIFCLCLIILFLIIYKTLFYIPPLLDQGKRNIAEKTIDFFCFGWHLTTGSIHMAYLKNHDNAIKEFAKAGWYRKKYLAKRFFKKEEDIDKFLEANRNLPNKSFREKLYVFLITPTKN